MDVIVTTSDQLFVSAEEVREALEAVGYYVRSVTVIKRGEEW